MPQKQQSEKFFSRLLQMLVYLRTRRVSLLPGTQSNNARFRSVLQGIAGFLRIDGSPSSPHLPTCFHEPAASSERRGLLSPTLSSRGGEAVHASRVQDPKARWKNVEHIHEPCFVGRSDCSSSGILPLTPALSLGERECLRPPSCKGAAFSSVRLRISICANASDGNSGALFACLGARWPGHLCTGHHQHLSNRSEREAARTMENLGGIAKCRHE